jgi:hypothetical protein
MFEQRMESLKTGLMKVVRGFVVFALPYLAIATL